MVERDATIVADPEDSHSVEGLADESISIFLGKSDGKQMSTLCNGWVTRKTMKLKINL